MHDFRKTILSYFKKQPDARLKIKQLAKTLRIRSDHYPDFRDTVKELEREGKLYRYSGHAYGLIDPGRGTLSGKLDLHPKGFAFVHTPDEQKIFIAEENVRSAAHGDIVEVSIHRKRKGDRLKEGHVTRILERDKDVFLSTCHFSGKNIIAVPAIHHLRTDILIDDLNGFSPKDGEHILAEITRWQNNGQAHRGRIKGIVGKESVPEFDAVMIANKHSIPEKFSQETLEQVEKIEFEIPDDPMRKDLRELTCFTIDPEDARDFDDAISIERDEEGNYRLGVHIADVSHYVPMDGALDKDALKRGTSVYFTDFVIHMLPEKLSTDLCSLKPDTDRLAMSIIIKLTPEGKTLSYEISPSVIHSRQRFSYEDVQHILDAKKGSYYSELSQLSSLAKILQKKRHEEGSIDFDLPEPVYELDENGIPLQISVRDRLWSHHLVEECMLLANQNVANFARTRGTNVPFIYRIHDIPEADSIYEWFAMMDAFGLKVSFFGMPITSKKFQSALEKVMRQNKSSYIMRTALRTMTKAKYSVKPVGHFGLAFQDYTHFTSPIRRYPDLMVHRLLKHYIRKKPLDAELKKQLKNIAKSCSEAEMRALIAEREYHKIKQMRYISTHIGEVFSGTISGVAQHGFWVELEDTFVEGFVNRDTLPKDMWDYDKRNHSLKGLRNKVVYQMGNKLDVRVIRADIKNGRADFEVVQNKKQDPSDRPEH